MSKIFISRTQGAGRHNSGRVTPAELMPLLATLEFNRCQSSKSLQDNCEAADVPTYRNELNALARNLTAHLPPENQFSMNFDGKYIGIDELFQRQIRLYDCRNAFKTLPGRHMYHDWALVFDGTPIFGTSLESFTLEA